MAANAPISAREVMRPLTLVLGLSAIGRTFSRNCRGSTRRSSFFFIGMRSTLTRGSARSARSLRPPVACVDLQPPLPGHDCAEPIQTAHEKARRDGIVGCAEASRVFCAQHGGPVLAPLPEQASKAWSPMAIIFGACVSWTGLRTARGNRAFNWGGGGSIEPPG